MDEKGFLLGVSNRAKVIVRRGRQNAEETTNGSRDWITAVETCSTTAMLPQMIIYKGKSLQRDWVKDIDEPEAVFAVSNRGYMTDELALAWLRNYFDVWTREQAADGAASFF